MKQKTTLVLTAFAIAGIIVLFSCSKSNNDGGTNPTGQTDSALLNIGKNVIIPSYQNLSTATAALDASVTAFTQAPNATTLANAQAAYKTAYLAWEGCSEYQFGPASDQSLLTNTINVFPTDSTVIKSNLSSGSYTIDGISNLKAQGFPAIDFLLFGADNAAILARFTTDAAAANAKTYLSAITASIKTKAATVAVSWSGNYINQFTSLTGVSAGSSLSLLVNSFVQDYDVVLKNYKLGIPIGKYGTTVLPQAPAKCEAYYSGISLQLLVQQVKAFQNIYTGGTGYGFDDKVIASKAQKNGLPLNDVINAEFTTLLAKLSVLSDPLSAAIVNNNAAVNDAYTEATKLVVLLKVDLSSALGVKISFQDDDGD
ncbi:MAG TPA: imelysin family protein [Chitinophagaceae bacterium]|nr:imelysin family protein [Chitinophagaceae bacterium]